MARDELGRWGEGIAAAYLRKKGYEILAANYRCRLGEIDLIAENKQFLVFVEVKLRKSAEFATARENVTAKKQGRIKQTALLYLAAHGETVKPARFDVIEVYAAEGAQTRKPVVTHLEDAFQ